jgi:hypothetical protein
LRVNNGGRFCLQEFSNPLGKKVPFIGKKSADYRVSGRSGVKVGVNFEFHYGLPKSRNNRATTQPRAKPESNTDFILGSQNSKTSHMKNAITFATELCF